LKKEQKGNYRRRKKTVDLHDIHELIEMGLSKEEISKEFGISRKYVQKMINDYYDDY
jgi:transposase